MNKPDDRSIDERIAELQKLAASCHERLLSGAASKPVAPARPASLPVPAAALPVKIVAEPSASRNDVEDEWAARILLRGEQDDALPVQADIVQVPAAPKWPEHLLLNSASEFSSQKSESRIRLLIAECTSIMPKVATIGRWTAAILLAGASALFLATWPHSNVFAVTTQDKAPMVGSSLAVPSGFQTDDDVRRVAIENIRFAPESAQAAASETTVKTVTVAALTPDQFIEQTMTVPGIVKNSKSNITHVDAVPHATSTAQATDAMNYLTRGEMLLRTGDVATARLMFRKAVEAGDVRGALGLASTYDPNVLSSLPVYGMQGNLDRAREWYEKAKELGAASEAGSRLEALGKLTN
jgi:hypothetical protein